MKVAVSACLLGENCKYSGGNNRCERLLEVLHARPDIEVIPVCPEVAGGLPTPRPPAEIMGGEVVNILAKAWIPRIGRASPPRWRGSRRRSRRGSLRQQVLQSRSPSCGVHQVYDGTFTGTLIPGQGLFAQALAAAGVRLVDASDLDDVLD